MIFPPAPPVNIPDVPFYSQFHDIKYLSWQKIGCGIASLAMVIDYYHPHAVSVNTLLSLATSSGAYDYNAGWIHKDLVSLAGKFGLDGNTYDYSKYSNKTAFAKFSSLLKKGPVIVSVHYRFDPKSSIPHLVVINGISDGLIYYNDPAAAAGEQQISVSDFLDGWKKRFIAVHPPKVESSLALAK